MCHLNGAPSNIFHFGKLSNYRCFRLSLTTLPSAQGLTKANHFSGPFRWIQLPLTGSMCVWTISKDVKLVLLKAGTQHAVGTVSNEATNDMGYRS